MSVYLSFSANGPVEQELVVVNGPPFMPWVLIDQDFGKVDWQHGFSGPRGTQGAKPIQGTLPNRTVTFALRGQASSKDQAFADLADLEAIIDAMRRFGGRITQRHHGQSYRQHYEVFVGAASVGEWGASLENRDEVRPLLSFICAPLALGDPMDIADGFLSDTTTDYTVEAGSIGNVVVDAGQLKPLANVSTETRLVHTATGYPLGDHEATIRFQVGSTVSLFRVGVVLKRQDAANYLEVYVDDTGTTSRLRVDSVTSSVRTNLDSVDLSRLGAGRSQWLRGRIEGNTVYAEFWYTDPDSYGPIGTRRTVQLGSADRATFGVLMRGQAGFSWTPQATDARLDDFEVLPFTYRGAGSFALPLAGYLHPAGEIPGNAPALGEIQLTTSATPFGMVAWAPAPAEAVNLIRDGGFESAVAADLPWLADGSGPLTGAVTGSFGQVAPGNLGIFGAYAGQITSNAAANRGIQQKVWQRFRANVTYTFSAWVYAPVATTPARLRVGSGADVVSSSAVALSATWTKRTVTWTPAADVDFAWVAIEVTAATATTFSIDGVMLYEGQVEPTGVQASEGFCTLPPVGAIPAVAGKAGILTDTASGSASFGRWLAIASAPAGGFTAETVKFDIEPASLAADDYSGGTVEVEVWADVVMSNLNGAVTMVAYVEQLDGYPIFCGTLGAAGRVIETPASGHNGQRQVVRVDSLKIPISDSRARTKLVIAISMAAGTGGQLFALDHIFLVPSRSRCLTPSGELLDSSYPYFVPSGLTWATRVVKPDLSGSVIDHGDGTRQPGPFEVADAALGGSLVELPSGAFVLAMKLADRVPDEPAPYVATSAQYTANLHIAVTPRWMNVRDA